MARENENKLKLTTNRPAYDSTPLAVDGCIGKGSFERKTSFIYGYRSYRIRSTEETIRWFFSCSVHLEPYSCALTVRSTRSGSSGALGVSKSEIMGFGGPTWATNNVFKEAKKVDSITVTGTGGRRQIDL